MEAIVEDFIQEACQETHSTYIKEATAAIIHRHFGVRTKDSKPYSAIHSRKYGRIVSDKNRAFYFKKDFLRDIRSGFLL